VALMLLAAWSIVLAASGSYGQLLDYATFADWLACAVTVTTLFWYRRRDAANPSFRAPWHPWLPLLFIGAVAAVVVVTMLDNPTNAGIGVLIVLAGIPVYLVWRRLFSKSQV
jgi:APA family basic amino acid/polyamine antiporter